MLEILTVPTLKDNYCYLVHAKGSKETLVIDPSEAGPIIEALQRHHLTLKLILNTHHHPDHVGGNTELVNRYHVPVYCSKTDLDRVPQATRGFVDEELVDVLGLHFKVLTIPGHTKGQIAFYFPNAEILFAGDTLFAMGCGRLFEGTPQEMWKSLARIKSLPETTRLFFGHEYSERNAGFAINFDSQNPDIEKRLHETRLQITHAGMAQAPTLKEELKVNPFLRAPDLETFTRLRAARDTWI